MGKINWGRVILGGLVAGAVLNAVDWFMYGVWLTKDYAAAMPQSVCASARVFRGQCSPASRCGFPQRLYVVGVAVALFQCRSRRRSVLTSIYEGSLTRPRMRVRTPCPHATF